MIRKYALPIVLTVLLLPHAFACSVPVFRYALESWEPANYELYVFHRGQLSETERALVESYRRAAEDAKAPVNVAVTSVDVGQKMDDHVQQIWNANKSETLPKVVVVFPDSIDSIWSGALSADLPRSLAESPARTEITKRLANGESAVFVLLEGNDAKQNAAAGELLEKELAGLQATVKLPQPDDADEHLPRRHKLDLPLRLGFSIMRISRSDEKEKTFANLLTKTDKKLSATQAVVLPIFGRGRVLCALTGTAINATSLADCATFVAGACSCQVKELNPGVDMLTAVNWDELLNTAVEKASKSPVGSTAAVPISTRKEEKGVSGSVTPNVPQVPSSSPPAVVMPGANGGAVPADDKRSGSRTILWFAVVGAAILVVITGREALKPRKDSSA